MKTKIILQRHGQSVGNAQRIYLGHTDLPLTEEGIMQAEVTAKHLADEPISAIYSSDLKRAYETALPHSKLHKLDIRVSQRLREIFVGEWDGKPMDELMRDCYEDFVIRRMHRDFVYPGGESTYDAANRLHKALLEIGRENAGGVVLVVSHSAVIRAFWYYLLGCTELNMTDRVLFMPNSAYCVLEFENDALVPVKYFCAEHLPKTNVHPV